MPESKPKPIPQLSPEDIARFHQSYVKCSPNECWLWAGTRFKNGYGRFYHFYATYKAHRIAYYLTNDDPAELLVLHHCDNPPCVNPLHLFKGTVANNCADKVKKGRHKGWRGNHPNAQGSKNYNAKLTEAQVIQIRMRRTQGAKWSELARDYAVSDSLCQFIVAGKAWSHVKMHGLADRHHLPETGRDKKP